MKTIGAALQLHLDQEVGTLTMCWKLTRQDATVMGFTAHHHDLTIDGLTYQSAQGFNPTASDTQAGLGVDNLDVQGFLDAVGITGADVLAGLYDGATLEMFLVNYQDLTQGTIKLRRGFLGGVKFGRQGFEAEVRGLMERFTRELCELYTPSCRADLGDTRCQVTMAPYTVTGALTAVTSRRVFQDNTRTEALHYFRGGLLTWLTGLNAGLSMEVKNWTLGTTEFELCLPMPYQPAIGDGYSVYAGCDKTLATCRDTFDNVVNFRGEPYVPQTVTESITAMR